MNNTSQGIDENVTLLLRLLLQTEKITDERLENALRDVQLTKAKMAALQQLIEAKEPLPLGQLAERLRCVKSNATTLVDRLEAEGLAERLHEPDDRRTVYATVTDKGSRRYEDGMQAIKAVERELLEHFTQVERASFIEYLSRLGVLWE
jgi:DNA-binding MarR family transcriptional regulator